MNKNELNTRLLQLKDYAILMGATAAAVIQSHDIRVDENLAALCNAQFACKNYGLAASCPPHVKGPGQFRKWQAKSRYAIAVKIELPLSVMFSNARDEICRLLHQVVAKTEQKAVELKFSDSRAFAGGSCKSLFCDKYEKCCVVDGSGPCRYKDKARPSMSGFGIDVARLMKLAGWSAKKAETDTDNTNTTTWLAGLVLIA